LRLSDGCLRGRPLVILHGSDGATALLGLDGFVVGAHELVDGEWWLLIETTADLVGCPACGVRAIGHGRRRVQVRDEPIAGRPVRLVWRKRIWRCREVDCEVGTWSETHAAITARSSLTERARAAICRRVGRDGDSVAAVASDYGIGWHCAMSAVITVGRPLVDDPGRLGSPGALGLDETSFLRASVKRHREMITGFVDLERHVLLDVATGRSSGVVRDWLDLRDRDWLDAIGIAVVDPFRGYANGLADRLPDATIVVDHFHAVRLANQAIDDCRRRVQQDTLGHRGRKDDPLYRIRRTLLIAHERLSDRQRERVVRLIRLGDRDGQVAATYLAKELLREFYAARRPAWARSRLRRFYVHCDRSGVRECKRLAATIRAWEAEVLAFHTTGRSNGPTEGINLLIKKIKRVGHGFRNLDNYRLRLLLHCGGVQWQTPRTARVRGRQPAFAA
jgi:transposase